MQSPMLGNSYPSRPKANVPTCQSFSSCDAELMCVKAVKAPGVGILGAAHAAPSPMSPEAQDGLLLQLKLVRCVPRPFLQNQMPPPPGPMRGMVPPGSYETGARPVTSGSVFPAVFGREAASHGASDGASHGTSDGASHGTSHGPLQMRRHRL